MDAVGVMGAALAMLVLAGLIAWSLTGGHPLGRFFNDGEAAPTALDRAAVAPAPRVVPKHPKHVPVPVLQGGGVA